MPFDVFEIAVNIVEPVLLFLLLCSKLTIINRRLPYAVAGIIVLAAATTVMNKLELEYITTTLISLTLYCLFSVLFFSGDVRLRLVWAAMMVYVIIFANTVLTAVLYTFSGSALITALEPSILRIVSLAAYIILLALLVLLVVKATRSIRQVTSKAAVGALISCVICIAAMYLLLEVTIAAASAGVSSIKYGLIAVLLMALVILLLILFGKASVWAQKYYEEHIMTESLKREVQYNSEMNAVMQSIRQLKHDYSNHMGVIASYAAEGDIEALRRYMEDYRSEYGIVDRYAITGDSTLDSLLSYKKMICDADEIDFKITAAGEDIRKTGLTAIELSSLFGNLIDNAINASRMLEPPKRKISLSIRTIGDMLSIRIENNRAVPDAEKNEGETRGLGLPRIKGIVAAHDGICTITPKDDKYSVEVLLSTKNEETVPNEA